MICAPATDGSTRCAGAVRARRDRSQASIPPRQPPRTTATHLHVQPLDPSRVHVCTHNPGLNAPQRGKRLRYRQIVHQLGTPVIVHQSGTPVIVHRSGALCAARSQPSAGDTGAVCPVRGPRGCAWPPRERSGPAAPLHICYIYEVVSANERRSGVCWTPPLFVRQRAGPVSASRPLRAGRTLRSGSGRRCPARPRGPGRGWCRLAPACWRGAPGCA